MKKAFVSLFSILAGITLVSCGPRRPDSGSNSTPTSTQASTPDSTPEIESKHAITLTQVEGVTLTSDKTEAKKDETVTITISNIAVGKKVTLKATPEVEFTQGSDANTYTFVMPDNDVSITAEVISVESNVQSFNIYMRGVTNLPKGSFSVSGEARTIDQLYAGEKVTLSFSDLSSSDFPKDKDFYLYVGDEIISSKVVQGEGEDEKLSLTFDFTVPEDKTDLVLVPAAGTIDEKGVGIKIDTLPEGIKVYGVKDGDKYASGQGAYLFVKKEAGYKVSLQYKSGTSDFQNGNLDSSGFAMIPLEGETEVKFTTENVGFHKITYVGAEDIASIDGKTDFSLPETYTVGERFTVSNIVAKDGKYIESIVVTGADGAKLYESLSSPSAIYFEMPDQDVTVTFTVKDNGKITFTGWEEYLQEAPKVIDGYSLKDKEVTSAAKGKYLNVYIKPKANYKVGALAYGEGKTSTFNQDWSNAGYFSAGFTMPEGDVTLSLANISTLYTVTIENSDTEGASITLNSTGGFAKGETVNFSVVVPDKTYALKSLIATYGDKTETWTAGKGFTLNDTGSSGSFTMVDGNVSIKPVFEKVQTVDVAVTADTGVTFSFRTSVSQATVGEAGTQKLLPNDQISFNSVATPSTDSAKYVQIQVTDSNNKVTNYDPIYLSIGGDSINYNYNANFAVTGEDGATVKAIKFALVDRAAIKTTVKNDTKAKLKFTINDKVVTDLSGLKQYDKLAISFDETTFEKGYAYSYTLKDAEGNPVTANGGTDKYLLLSSNPLTLEVTQKKSYSATINIAPADSAISYQSWGMTVDGNSVYSQPTTFLEGAKVNITYITISDKSYQPYSWTLEVKVGDNTYKTDSNKILSTPLTFTVDGDVVFNFTLS